MSKNGLRTYGSIFGFCLLVLIGCKPHESNLYEKINATVTNPQYLNQSWLTGEAYQNPYWHGLTPGKSTREEALTKIKDLPFLIGDNPVVRPMSQDVMLKCKEPQKWNCVYLKFASDSTLELLVLYPNFNVTFEKVVSQLGPPQGFTIYYFEPDIKDCGISLLWVDKLMEINYYEHSPFFRQDHCEIITASENRIPKYLEVGQVTIWNAKEIQKLTHASNYKPWVGFIDE